MKMFVLLMTLLSTNAVADECDSLRIEANDIATKLTYESSVIDALDRNIYKIETILLSETLGQHESDVMYAKYIDAHVLQRQLNAEYRVLEDRSFMVEVLRIRNCGLTVTYTPKRRNKKV